MKKILLMISFLISLPLVHAQEEKCGLSNLAACISQKLYEYTLSIINAPLQPFLTLVKNLLAEPVNIEIFISIWAVIIYILSIFYGLFLIFAGFNFLISGYSAEKRESAKMWLRHVILMMIFIQASYYLYSILIDLSSSMTAGILDMIDQKFFLLTVDSFTSLGIQLILAIPYMLALLLSVILLALRYILVSTGVLFFPIGLFFYFIPPLQSYGKLVINVLLTVMFLPFIQSLILLAASKIMDLPSFQNYKIVIMVSAFILINLSMLLLILFALAKAAMNVMSSDVGRAVAIVAK